jgi:hypothetical protein
MQKFEKVCRKEETGEAREKLDTTQACLKIYAS